MRDPNRISEILVELGRYWLENPDARLAQIVGNVNSIVRPNIVDPYYMEDDEFLHGLRTLNDLHKIQERSREHDDNSDSGNSKR